MTLRWIAGPAIITLGMGLGGASAAPYLQPDMQTMIQQGGAEGTTLGELFAPSICCEAVWVPAPRPVYGPRSVYPQRVRVRLHRSSAVRGTRHLSER